MPGHSDDGVAFVVNETVVFTGDTLFRGSVGGGDFATLRRSVMEVLMPLPPELRVLPAIRTRPRSAPSGSRTRSSESGRASTRRATSRAASAASRP